MNRAIDVSTSVNPRSPALRRAVLSPRRLFNLLDIISHLSLFYQYCILLIPVVVVSVVFWGVGVVTGPVTVVSLERSPAGPTTTVLGATPAVESVKVSKTVLAVRPRQSYVIVIGVEEGSMLVVEGGNV
jgi:hypothetical protein